MPLEIPRTAGPQRGDGSARVCVPTRGLPGGGPSPAGPLARAVTRCCGKPARMRGKERHVLGLRASCPPGQLGARPVYARPSAARDRNGPVDRAFSASDPRE